MKFLGAIEAEWHPAFSSDTQAMSHLVQSLHRLGEVNRISMQQADNQARRLGFAGAWAAVIFGFSGFLLSLLAMRRLAHRFVRPVEEIHDVLLTFHRGERYRRCGFQSRFPEFQEIRDGVNRLMDAHWSPAIEADRLNAGLNRAALLYFMDGFDRPMVLLDAEGGLNAVNQAMTELLDGADGDDARAVFEQVVSDSTEDLPGDVSVAPLASRGWVVALGTGNLAR